MPGKLYTRDKLIKWGVTSNIICHLCDVEAESVIHLFFKCSFAASIWNQLLIWLGVDRQATMWVDEQAWAIQFMNGKNSKAELYRMSLVGCAYYVLQERNQRIFKDRRRENSTLVR
ncbi:PREDICTED: uncharacterized protein LOC109240844 [Nicotiana attenuata]|uniref:uncharacterized protein LOC109240844 n=1 Tax=Nicotiana attenuata TaxID=49451 RepID=UPI0009059FB7|nr:PREDICTED: uncharacterized protein LOC109240844 [Nicotiana attenuata]